MQQLEHNLKFDFSMTGDDGKELEPLFGVGLTGLKNLGNSWVITSISCLTPSCYMASVMQTLLSLPSFRSRYYTQSSLDHMQTCDIPLPATCLECQMLKLADGLESGRYSHLARPPPPSLHDTEPPKFQEGIRPADFKALIGKGHEEFATMRQQDSEEFLQHLLGRLRAEQQRLGSAVGPDPTQGMRFGMEQRLECTRCHRVGYMVEAVDLASLPVEAVQLGEEEGRKIWQPVDLNSCLRALTRPEELSDYACSHCEARTKAVK